MTLKTRTTTKAALLLAVALVTAHSARAVLVDVYANANSLRGGTPVSSIYLTSGQLFTVSADPGDLWNAGILPRWSNADGLVKNLYATGADESGQPVGTLIGRDFGLYSYDGFSAPFGMLVGKIGSQYIRLGTHYSGTAPDSGWLQLLYWDSNNFDNTQQITALSVAVTPVPEVSTILAGMALLIPFGTSTLRFLRKNRAV